MSDVEVEFVARPSEVHNEPRRALLGVAMTVLVATMTVILSVDDVRASCESQEAAVEAGSRYLQATGAMYRCDSKTFIMTNATNSFSPKPIRSL